MRGISIVVGAVLVALTASCRGEKVGGSGDGLEVSPSSLDFGNVYLGATPVSTLTIKNDAAFSRPLSISVSSPFIVEPFGSSIAGGDSMVLSVHFMPEAIGAATGKLEVASESFDLAVTLNGVGLGLLECPVASSCRQNIFDPATGICVASVLSDGTACSTACASSGRCESGRCIGTATACDDHDACTTDSCDVTGGCFHSARTCSPPTDPCRVAVCDPVIGCGEALAEDGSSCGPADCDTSMVCLAGTCQSRDTPEGATCGSPIPCRSPGICQAHQCVLPPQVPLTQRWSRPFDANWVFPGLSDAAGNLYWYEGNQLVSVDRDGVDRYRVTMLAGGAVYALTPIKAMLASDELIVEAIGIPPTFEKLLEARNTSDGSLRWFYGLEMLARGLALDADEFVNSVDSFAVQGVTGRVMLLAQVGSFQLQKPGRTFVVGIEPKFGAIEWTFASEPLEGLVSDAAGTLYSFRTGDQKMVAIAPDGTITWSVDARDVPLLAVEPGVLSIGQLNDATTGAARTFLWPAVDPVSDGVEALSFPGSTSVGVEIVSLVGALDDRRLTWSPLSMGPASNLMLTSNGTALVAWSGELMGFSDFSEFACDGLDWDLGDAVLSSGQWVVQSEGMLHAYDLSGWSLNPTGWASARSDMHRSNMAH